jgi:hypothetical protein
VKVHDPLPEQNVSPNAVFVKNVKVIAVLPPGSVVTEFKVIDPVPLIDCKLFSV